MESVVTAVRCRPFTKEEQSKDLKREVVVSAKAKQVVVSGERAFTLSHVYGDDSTQDDIYNDLVQPTLDKVMDGYNACVMAYGQTGSGKSYTMGTDVKASTPGLVQRVLQKVFSSEECKEVYLSFLEIYKEEVLDLLATSRKRMQVVDFKPVGLTLVEATDVQSAINVMELGLKNRHVGATNANLRSSRSHAVFTIHFKKTTGDSVCTSKMYLVDLAGSESVSDLASADMRKEGVMINKGLLQLGNVMAALSTAGQEHIPYRNSALTAILKDTLSPTNFVVLIACLNPYDSDASKLTLQFASRVASIRCNPESGVIIKQRIPMTTPFKVPLSYAKRVNSTIATPGSHQKIPRPALRPINKTFDSPRSSRLAEGKGRYLPTSTPFLSVAKPLFADPTPIVKIVPKRPNKRRSSSESVMSKDWDHLDISTSTVVDMTTNGTKSQMPIDQSGLIPNAENESWLRSIITDVIREELKSHTIRYPSPSPKKMRRSPRLLEVSSFFDHKTNATVFCHTSSPNQPECTGHKETEPTLRSPRVSPKPTPPPRKPSQRPSDRISVRRSARLSVLPQQNYSDSPIRKVDSSNEPASKQKQTKKEALNTRLSLLPKVTPEDAQKQINEFVLDILKYGDVKKLQSLPTIGPKTAVVICNHRLLRGPINSFNDLGNIQGLSQNFVKRFLWANNITEDVNDGE